jgi:hypothetical protein
MSYLQGQWKYGKAKEAVVHQGWSIATRTECEKVEKRKEKKKTKEGEKVAPAKARFRVP